MAGFLWRRLCWCIKRCCSERVQRLLTLEPGDRRDLRGSCLSRPDALMSSTQRLQLRQGQSLTMTPQLLQSIRLLQLSHSSSRPSWSGAGAGIRCCSTPTMLAETLPPSIPRPAPPTIGTPDRAHLPVGRRAPPTRPASKTRIVRLLRATPEARSMPRCRPRSAWRIISNLQLDLATADPRLREIGRYLIHSLSEAGYLMEETDAIAEVLGCQPSRGAGRPRLLQGFDPPGSAPAPLPNA